MPIEDFNILSIDAVYEYENNPKICIGEKIKLAASF